MTITATELTTGASSTDSQATYTTNTITPATNGNPIIIFVGTSRGSATTPYVASAAGLGLTWVSTPSNNIVGSGVSLRCTMLFGTGTASAGTVVLTMSGATASGIGWCVAQFAGADPVTPYVAGHGISSTVTTAQSSTSLTLPFTPAPGNMVVGMVTHNVAAESISPGTNFAVGTRAGWTAPNVSVQAEYKTILSTTVDASWATSSVYSAWGYEIAAASGAGQTDFMGAIPI